MLQTFFFTILTIIIWTFSSPAFSQTKIRGTVKESRSEKPVPYATLFFPELNLLKAADSTGSFTISKIPSGTYTLQVSHISYEPYVRSVSIHDTMAFLEIRLDPTLLELPEVVIYGNQNSALSKTSFNISSMSSKEMKENGAYNLSDAVAKIPGMSQISTGVAISKPVIRGLYGNRIQTVLMGIRFDNQQWQDEHGLGLSNIGIDRIEIIKGPASIMYGSEAMGGVLDIIEEKPVEVGKSSFDATTQFFSNTLGSASNIGYKKTSDKRSFRIRGGYESHADYSDGNGHRVLNSRYNGYHVKASLRSFTATRTTTFNFMSSFTKFGFVTEDNAYKKEVDSRISRTLDGPFHAVFLNILSVQNIFSAKKYTVKWNAGVHSNLRKENEGGNAISLNMLLNTFNSDLQWTYSFAEKFELTAGTQEMYQTNRNLGWRIIVPDANFWEASLFSFLKYSHASFIAEAGIRYDHKNVTSILEMKNAIDESTIPSFANNYDVMNATLGTSVVLLKYFNLKMNGATGYRAPNLAELASNGLHEGTYRIEVGNRFLNPEQNLNLETSLTFEVKDFSLTGALYRNRIFNYIFLSPTSQVVIFPVYNYVQKDATIEGGELQAVYHPRWLKKLMLNASYSFIEGKTDQHEYLPFIPANRLMGEVRLNLGDNAKTTSFLKGGITYVCAQNKTAQFETPSDAYYLVNAGLGITKKNTTPWELVVSCNNLLNTVYVDHLSRFKYYGINNIGRNITLTFNCTIQ